jgi:alkylation response protein AidB-like acyl-CoA dehydrogenase
MTAQAEAARVVAMRDQVDQLAEGFAVRAAEHDRDGSFVAAQIETLRATGYLAAPVPIELGGDGARLVDVVGAQRALAAVDASTALASSMHLHAVLTAAWRWRRGETIVEPMLRKVAAGAFVASTGGGDFVASGAIARPDGDAFVVDGRKHFVSGAPAADLFATWARVEGTDELIGFGVPAGADGVRVDEVWDSVGMRGTGSHDLVLTGVRIPAAAVNGRRRIGEPHPLLVGIAAHALPVVIGVYLGVAEGARDAVVGQVRARGDARPATRRLLGLIDHELLVAALALDGLIAELGEVVDPSPEVLVRVMLVKRFVAATVQEVLDRCMEVAGGTAFLSGSPVGRAWRDVRGAGLHPLGGEQVLAMAGAAALGEEVTTV